MLRPSPLPHARAASAARLTAILAAVVLTVLATLAPLGPSPRATAASGAPLDPEQPLVPQISSITPDYVPEHGPIVITGTVTNASDQTWTSINVHGFMGSAPITSAEQLDQAAQTPVDADVGHRITTPGTFDSIRRLAPGESAPFEVRLPHRTLPVSVPGVYWFGVHVLGDNGEGDLRVAVGRDRTFLPYVPASAVHGVHENAALVVPVRAAVLRGANGAVTDPQTWTQSVRSGPLHDVVATGLAAGGQPLTYLVDPAVPDVVRAIARGNPARTLTSQATGGGQSPSPSPSEPSAAGSGAVATTSAAVSPTASGAAARWLSSFQRLLAGSTSQVLGLPYGDVAVENAAVYDAALLKAAYRRTGHTLRPWGVPLTPVAAPPSGRSSSEALAQLPRATQVLLSDDGVAGQASVVDRVQGRRLVLTSSAAAKGGPGPVAPTSSLALRQRILAEAALRVLDDQQPLVVVLPTQVTKPLGAGFFAGLDVPWLRLTTVGGASSTSGERLDPTRLRQPPDDSPQLGPRAYVVAQEIQEAGGTLQSVLPGNKELASLLFQEVTGNTSYTAAEQPYLALQRLRSTDAWVRQNLRGIDLAAPLSVTLASTSGKFSAVVSNALDVPVTVAVHAVADPRLHITGGETVDLPPHGQRSVLLQASTHVRGVHTVTLELTSPDGRPLPGAIDQFPMRSEQVSGLIWVIIGVGLALLFTAIVVRLTRRILRERARRRAARSQA